MRISLYLLVPAVAWLLSQVLKYILKSLKFSSLKNVSYLYSSGDMPSSHASLIVSLLAVIGVRQGVDSSMFGVVSVMAVIVLYDALNVRRSVGEQASMLKKVLAKIGSKEAFYVAKGHTVAEVLVGSLLGLITALLMLQFL